MRPYARNPVRDRRLVVIASRWGVCLSILAACAAEVDAQAVHGFGFMPGQTTWTVLSIDSTTGTFTPLVPVTPLAGVVTGSPTFDPVGQRLFFISPPSELYTVNVTSGMVSHVTMPSCCPFLFAAPAAAFPVPAAGPIALLVFFTAMSLVGLKVILAAR